MAHNPMTFISRRQVVVAGIAAVGWPSWAAQPASPEHALRQAAPKPGEPLVLSGRLCEQPTQALAGACIEFCQAGSEPQVTWADADGRFLMHSKTPSGPLTWRASVNGRAVGSGELHLDNLSKVAGSTTHLECDTAGVWRAAAELKLV